MARSTDSLSGLAFVEREMSWLADEAAAMIQDPGVAERVRRLRDEHESAAATLGDAVRDAGGDSRDVPQDVREDVRALQRGVRHSTDQDGLVTGMLEAERTDLRMYEQALDEGLSEDAGRLVRSQLGTARQRVAFLEDIVPAMAPDIGGSRSVPGRTPGAV